MNRLTEKELIALRLAASGQVVGEYRAHYKSGASKLRHGVALLDFELPEQSAGCDYSAKWMREHQEEANRIIEAHQRGCEAAFLAYWECRKES